MVRRRKQIDDLKAQSATRTAETSTINEDQDRIRKNMQALDHNTALYKRYVSELDAQETTIGKLRYEAATLDKQIAAAEMALRAYVDTIAD